MSVALATAWNPRGEMSRFERLYPVLKAVYSQMAITLPPQVAAEVVELLRPREQVLPVVTTAWPQGRYLSIKMALETGADHIHYVDFDRLLRWVETRPDEWRRTVQVVTQSDFLVIGRTPQAWETHPRALRDTEAISNAVISHLVGQELDLSAGSKGFSQAAAQMIVANASADRPMGADAEWVLIAHRAGFRVDSVRVDGLDWESADRYQDTAANGDAQRAAAARYDEDPQHWSMRVAVAAEIVQAGLETVQRELVGV